MKKYVIIVAGGKGLRFKSEVPKQFLDLAGKPVLMHTIHAFYHYSPEIQIIVVLPKEQFDFWKSLCNKHGFEIPHQLVEGGRERYFSVKNGLSLVEPDSLVAIHDGVRPLVDKNTIGNCFKMAENKGNAIPVVDLVDSIRELDKNGLSTHANRSRFKLVQTPQVFLSSLIKSAYQAEFNEKFTDDASVLEAIFPGTINLADGNRENIKITSPEDLLYASAILNSRTI